MTPPRLTLEPGGATPRQGRRLHARTGRALTSTTAAHKELEAPDPGTLARVRGWRAEWAEKRERVERENREGWEQSIARDARYQRKAKRPAFVAAKRAQMERYFAAEADGKPAPVHEGWLPGVHVCEHWSGRGHMQVIIVGDDRHEIANLVIYAGEAAQAVASAVLWDILDAAQAPDAPALRVVR